MCLFTYFRAAVGLCGSSSNAMQVQQWCLAGWAPWLDRLFQHNVTPAMYTLGTCLTCHDANNLTSCWPTASESRTTCCTTMRPLLCT